MSENPFWRCGHRRTAENTVGPAKGQCRECNRRLNREAYQRLSPSERYRKHRLNYLPRQIEAAEHKLAALRAEAARLGMQELLNPRPGETHGL